jgi:hypothetical protein
MHIFSQIPASINEPRNSNARSWALIAPQVLETVARITASSG